VRASDVVWGGAFLAVVASAITYFAQGFVVRSLKHEFASLDEEKPPEERGKAKKRMGRSKLGFGIVNTFAILFGVMALYAFVDGSSIPSIRRTDRPVDYRAGDLLARLSV
jgi:hypothetical protein